MNYEIIRENMSRICRSIFALPETIVFVDSWDLTEDLGMDSITFITLIVEIEEYFGIILPDETILMENFKTVADVTRIVSQCLDNKGE